MYFLLNRILQCIYSFTLAQVKSCCQTSYKITLCSLDLKGMDQGLWTCNFTLHSVAHTPKSQKSCIYSVSKGHRLKCQVKDNE